MTLQRLFFPDVDGFYDGLFSAATTHIFSEAVVFEIAKEYLRVVRPGGKLVLDMLGDIKRIKTDENLYVYPGEISYSTGECKALLKKAFSDCKVEIVEGSIIDEPRSIGETEYKLNATQVIVVVEKTKR